MSTHPFDAAIALQPQGDHLFAGATHPAWANFVGPFGGISAAVLLNAVMQHPQRIGDPVALTVNYAAATETGAFSIEAVPARTNRSTQHWTLTLRQAGGVVLTGTVMTAVRRDTWAANDMPMPDVPPPEVLPTQTVPQGVEWLNRYRLCAVRGGIPAVWEGQSASEDPTLASLTQMWIRDEPPRPLDFCALAAKADAFFPRIWLRRATRVPVGTVTMTVYFHVSSRGLAETGDDYLLAQARAQAFGGGYFDQTGQLWNRAGHLLVSTHQVVYYKE